jgi:squalene-hopene/tetraprenyl-beta-curcumene cyclase
VKHSVALLILGSLLTVTGADLPSPRPVAPAPMRTVRAADWSPTAAARYLDARLEWWESWPNAARDHGTSCVSCHTALPYALARPTLGRDLGEAAPPAVEQHMLDGVTKRVRLWREVEPFYPDQTVGLPKTSESRGTEAVLNALVLATRDAEAGTLSQDGLAAFENLWALQMKTGDLDGAWPWLDFGLEPWEAPESPYFGASLAAIAVGTAPGGYAQRKDVQPSLDALRKYLQKGAGTGSLFERLMALWASSRLSGVLQPAQRDAIVAAAVGAQAADGGWSLGSLGPWRRTDGSSLAVGSDGFATALTVLALEQAGVPADTDAIRRGRAWLVAHQDEATGAWPASSVNKERDPESDRGKFMNDAATAYAALALSGVEPR